MSNKPGPRLVETGDDSFAVVEADGTTSVKILTSMKDANHPYRIRHWTSTQEIYDETGKTVARTTDPEMATHICNLLIVWVRMKQRAASGSLPDAQKERI
jgi:hypothetical protein